MHLTDTQLNDYADGLLTEGDIARVREHVATCAECARELEHVMTLQAKLAELPHAIAPDRDLRAGIWQQVDSHAHTLPRSHARTLWGVRYQLMAAAIALVLISSGITAVYLHDRYRTTVAQYAANDGSRRLVNQNVQALDAQYTDELQELQAVLKKSRGTLAPETVQIIETNLKIIDDAIGEARAALAADPNSRMLIDLLRSAYERKLELLRQAAKSSVVT